MEPPDKRARRHDLRDTNHRTVNPAHPLNNRQFGEVRAKGSEPEAHRDAEAGWRGIAAYSHMDARVSRSTGSDLDKRLAYAQRRTVAAACVGASERPLAGGAGLLRVQRMQIT